MKSFDLYTQVHKELSDFKENKVHIAGTKAETSVRYLNKGDTGYEFSQWQMINLIDLYYNSKFETGLKDAEGQRKIFLNICKFRSDVAAKQIDLDVKNFNFIPEQGASAWPAFFIGREFAEWAKESYFSELLNDCVENFPKYGWVVLKQVKGKLEFVPLQTIRNQQDASSLNKASYVIIEHPNMTLAEMQAMKGWNTEGLDMEWDETDTVYERYGFAPKYAVTGNMEDTEIVDTLSICTAKKDKKANIEGHTLFFEEISKRPFIEAHWSKVHGRLMGAGEIENQIENQIGANLAFNLFRRQLLWSSKKIFQSSDENIAKNLVRDVKDGDVLQIGPNGNISQVDMTDRAVGDFNSFSNILDDNSDKKSFTYEVATGESLPSGTPFRLGVLVANSVNSHFALKQEKLGLMLKDAVVNHVLPEFKKAKYKRHTISLFSDNEGFEALKQAVIAVHVNDAMKQAMLRGDTPNPELLKIAVEQQLKDKQYMFAELPEGFYEDIKSKIVLTITGEEVDLPKKIETMTNLYTALAQKGDPRADRVLARILSYTGENFDMLAGAPEAQPAPQGQGQASPIQQNQVGSSLNQPTSPGQLV